MLIQQYWNTEFPTVTANPVFLYIIQDKIYEEPPLT